MSIDESQGTGAEEWIEAAQISELGADIRIGNIGVQRTLARIRRRDFRIVHRQLADDIADIDESESVHRLAIDHGNRRRRREAGALNACSGDLDLLDSALIGGRGLRRRLIALRRVILRAGRGQPNRQGNHRHATHYERLESGTLSPLVRARRFPLSVSNASANHSVPLAALPARGFVRFSG